MSAIGGIFNVVKTLAPLAGAFGGPVGMAAGAVAGGLIPPMNGVSNIGNNHLQAAAGFMANRPFDDGLFGVNKKLDD